MIIFRYVLLYVIILSYSIFIADLGNKKLEKTIPFSLISIILILYLFGLINLLSIGVYVIVITSMILLVYTIFKHVKNHTMKKLEEKIISVGTLFFSIIFFLFMITTANKQLMHWDQFSYWSISVKEMFYTNDLLITAENIVAQYPPVPTLLQYFFMKVIGEYRQGVEAFAIWLLCISFFLPFFEKSNGKKLTNVMISILILCVPAIFNMLNFYESSYPDVLLGILIGYLSYLYFCEKNTKWKTVTIILTFILLTLIKPIGVVISLILLMTFVLFEFITQGKKKKKLKDRIFSKEFKTLALFLVAIAITYMSWTVYVKIERRAMNLQNDTAAIIKEEGTIEKVIKGFFTTVLGSNQENIKEANSNGSLINKLYQVTEISTPIKLSAAGLICIFILITVVYYERQKELQEKQQMKQIFLCLLVGLVLYIGALQLAYLTQFSTKEMIYHDGMERYIGSYLLGIFFFIIAYSLEKIKTKDKKVGYLLLTSIILMITPIYSVANATITSGIYNLNTIYDSNINRIRANDIQKVVEQEKILGIYQEIDKEFDHLMVRYYLYPTCYYVKKIEEMDELKQWIAQKQYNYLYVMNIEEELIKQLENEFSIKIENDTLFKITDQGLEKIK